MFAMLLS